MEKNTAHEEYGVRHPAPRPAPHPGPGRPGLRRLRIEFEAEDRELLKEIFGDEDTAGAAEAVLAAGPEEILALGVQCMQAIRIVREIKAGKEAA